MEVIKRPSMQAVPSADAIPAMLDMSDSEKSIALSLMSKSSEDISVFIPEDIDKDTFLSWIMSSIKIHSTFNMAQRRVQPIIGRMLLLVARRKDLLSEFSCKTFTEFMTTYVPKTLKMGAQDAWDSLFVAREFPGLTCEEFETVGFKNLKIIHRAIPTATEDKKAYSVSQNVYDRRKKLVDIVTQNGGMKADDLARTIESMGIAEKKDIIKNHIVIKATESMIEEWDKFCSDARIIRVVGSEDPAVIFRSMMAECLPAWIAMGQMANE